MIIQPEQSAQIIVCDFARAYKLPFFHIANERRCSFIYGKLLKKMGVVKGFSDIFMPRGNNNFKGLFIELKAGKNKPTPSQIDFINKIILEGYAGHIAYGADEAISIIKSFYGLNLH